MAEMGFVMPSPPPFDLEEWRAFPLISATTSGLGGLSDVGSWPRVVMLESQPAHIQRQRYRIHDAASGAPVAAE